MRIQESFLPSFPFFHLLLHWVRQLFLGIPPFISDPGSLGLFFILIFCESMHDYYTFIRTYIHIYVLYLLVNLDLLGMCVCTCTDVYIGTRFSFSGVIFPFRYI